MINAEKIYMGALNKIDSSQILKWINDPEMRDLVGTIYPVNDVEHEIWYERKLKDSQNKMFGIYEKTECRLIGIIGFKNFDSLNRNAEIYLYIGEKELWGKGYGTEAVTTMLNYLFNNLNLHRVYLEVFNFNKRAIKSYEKIGFVKEGVLRESKFYNGTYIDKFVMGILKNDLIIED